jgi:hypothetical protein
VAEMTLPARFYRMFVADGFGVAFSPPEIDGVDLIPDEGEILDWTPLELTIKPGEWQGPSGDYVNSDLAIRLCSRRLKELFDSLRSEADRVQWLPAYVTDLQGDRVEHFVLHFQEPPDVLNLNPDETIYDEESGVLIRPCLSRAKVGEHKLFNITGLEIATVVEERVKRAIESAGMQGIEFCPIRTRD